MTTQLRALKVLTLSMFLLSVCSFNLMAQNPTPSVIWQKTIGGSSWDEATETQPTTDGGSITVGYSHSPASGDKSSNNYSLTLDTSDIWIVKLDALGAIQWEKTILANNFDGAQSVKQTADGGYLIGGTSSSGIAGDKTEASFGEFDFWIIKLDANGNILWQKTIGGTFTDVLQDLHITSDGGFIAAGYSNSGITGNKTVASLGNNDMWVIKFDANGVEQWQKSHGTNAHDIVNEIKLTNDGGYILGGHVYGYNSSIPGVSYYGAYDFLVIKIDANGTLQWQKTYGGSGDDYVEALQQTTDGGYILGGYSSSNISGVKTENMRGTYLGDYWIVKIDAQGMMQWQKTIGGNNMDWLETIQQTADGGYVMCGYSYSPISADKTEAGFSDADIWIVKTNNTGSIQWQKVLGGSSYDMPASLQQLDEGNGNYAYLIGGYSASSISGNKTENSKGDVDFWVVKLGDLIVNTPSVSDVYYCPNNVAAPLTAAGQDLLWYTTVAGGVGSTTAPTPSTTTAGITTYYVSQTINNVESPRVPLNVVVKTPPSVTITGLGTMCAGTSQSISAYAGASFVWNDGVTTGQRTIAPTTTTTYTVTITGHNGCTNTGSRTFIVSAPPVASIVAANSICNGTSTTLTASSGSNSGTYGFRWSTGQWSSGVSGTITVAPNSTRTYSVTVTTGNCTSVANKMITVTGVAPSAMNIVGLNTSYIKTAPAVTLIGSPTGGTFRVDNVVRTNFNPAILTVGNHTVTYTITNGLCNSVITRTVVVLAPPVSLLSNNTQMVIQSQLDMDKVHLEWVTNADDRNDYFIIQKANKQGVFVDMQTLNAQESTYKGALQIYKTEDTEPFEGDNVYRIKTVMNDSNVAFSDTKTVIFKRLGNVMVYPNPTTEFIDINLQHYMGQATELRLSNMFGQNVVTQKVAEVTANLVRMDLNHLQAGSYLLRISSKGKRDEVIKISVHK